MELRKNMLHQMIDAKDQNSHYCNGCHGHDPEFWKDRNPMNPVCFWLNLTGICPYAYPGFGESQNSGSIPF